MRQRRRLACRLEEVCVPTLSSKMQPKLLHPGRVTAGPPFDSLEDPSENMFVRPCLDSNKLSCHVCDRLRTTPMKTYREAKDTCQIASNKLWQGLVYPLNVPALCQPKLKLPDRCCFDVLPTRNRHLKFKSQAANPRNAIS